MTQQMDLWIEPDLEIAVILSEDQVQQKVETRIQKWWAQCDTVVAWPVQTETPGPKPEEEPGSKSDITATTTLLKTRVN